MRYAKPDKQTIKWNLLRGLKRFYKICRFRLLEKRECAKLIGGQFEEIIKICNQLMLHEKPHSLLPHAGYIKRAPAREMNEFTRLLLKRALGLTAMGRFPRYALDATIAAA